MGFCDALEFLIDPLRLLQTTSWEGLLTVLPALDCFHINGGRKRKAPDRTGQGVVKCLSEWFKLLRGGSYFRQKAQPKAFTAWYILKRLKALTPASLSTLRNSRSAAFRVHTEGSSCHSPSSAW